MTTSDKVIQLLNENEQAKRFNKMWNEQTEKFGLAEEEKKNAEMMKMYIILLNNKEAIDIMAEEAYYELRK